MLIITRRPGERVLIGKDVWIEVTGIRGAQVRLAITAPEDVNIVREELLLKDHQRRNNHDR